jgi:D-alanine-D-alanine ligase
MRVAVIYNKPKAATPEQRWMCRSRPGGSALPANACDVAEFGVLHQVELVKRALLEGGHQTVVFGVDNITQLAGFVGKDRPDIIFNCCESLNRDAAMEVNVAALYELLAIPFTGSSALTLGISLNKALAKMVFQACGILTPPYAVFPPGITLQAPALGFPLIVKPLCEDAGIGIDENSLVETEKDLFHRVRFIWREFDQPALVEEFIDGRELNIAVLATSQDRLIALPISEIVFSGLPGRTTRIVGYEAKWLVDSDYYRATAPRCPADLPAAMMEAAQTIALRAARATGLRDYGRIDLRVRFRDSVIFVLEANPNPDIGCDSGFVRASQAGGWTHTGVILEILQRAIERAGLSNVREVAAAAS